MPVSTLNDALRRNATLIGDRPALHVLSGAESEYLGEVITWREVNARVMEVARELRRDGTDVPLVHSVQNHAADIVIALACAAIGMVEVPVDIDGGETYLQACRDAVGGRWLDDDSKRELISGARSNRGSVGPGEGRFEENDSQTFAVDPDGDSLVLWTSGTSGNPKGVMLSQRSLLLNAQSKLAAVPQQNTDRRLTVLSIAHGYARTCDIGTWILSGCELAVTRAFSGWCSHADRFQPTLCNMVPSLAARALDEDRIPSSLRLLGCGGAAMSANRFAQFQRLGVTVIQGYGLTEAGPVIASQTPDDSIAGHVGKVVAGWEHRIDDGRLFVRGDHLMSRYWGDPHSTEQRINEAGWLDTGDLVRVDDGSGQLKILGRADDRIVLANGHKVDPHGLEQRFTALVGVQTAVIAPSSDGRSVELWFEGEVRAEDDDVETKKQIQAMIDGLPRWERPAVVRRFRVATNDRTRLFNRKGAMRRGEMLTYLKASTSSV